jgi:hypothetical protein
MAKEKKPIASKAFSGACAKDSGIVECDDPWLEHLCREVNRACDKFWTLTEERRIVDREYHNKHPFLQQI